MLNKVGFRSLIKRIIPTLVVEIYRNKIRKKVTTFKGIFNSFDDVKDEDPWDGDNWKSIERYKLEQKRIDNLRNELVSFDYSCLCLLLVNQISLHKTCCVLDYAGGGSCIS